MMALGNARPAAPNGCSMPLAELLSRHLPANSVSWLVMLFDSVQVFDDVQDGDAIQSADLHACIWHTLVAMPQNPFFAANAQALLPAVATAIMKWHAANASESACSADAKSFVWRAGFYDVVLLCVILCRGPEYAQANAEQILRLYGESLPDYLTEFENA